MIKFLRMLTFLPLEEISALEEAMSKPEYVPNTAQRCLAEAVTRCGVCSVLQLCMPADCPAQQFHASVCCVPLPNSCTCQHLSLPLPLLHVMHA